MTYPWLIIICLRLFHYRAEFSLILSKGFCHFDKQIRQSFWPNFWFSRSIWTTPCNIVLIYFLFVFTNSFFNTCPLLGKFIIKCNMLNLQDSVFPFNSSKDSNLSAFYISDQFRICLYLLVLLLLNLEPGKIFWY